MKRLIFVLLFVFIVLLIGCWKKVTYEVTFYDIDGNIIDVQTVNEGEEAILPNYENVGDNYYIGVNTNEYLEVHSNLEVHPIYEVNPDIVLLEETYWELCKIYKGNDINSSIFLLNSLGDVDIEWSSNNIYLTNEGKFKRPYKEMKVSLGVKLSYNGREINKEIEFNLKGYKDLKNIASGYVYRGYDKLTENFFETMDIIYCAFLLFNDDGTFKANTTVLENILKYVIPKAHQKGIYVVASLGGGGDEPRKAFVNVTKDEATRKKFTEEVMKLVDKYGFDGIDIDWETPTSSEAPYFTLLVKELNEKLKAKDESLLLTAAITGGKWQPPRYDLKNSGKYLDYVNVMTYGMCYSNGNYQNALYRSTEYNDKENGVGNTLETCSIQESIDVFNDLKVSNDKLIFGAAFYGVKQKKSNGKWSSNGSISYTNIKDLMNSDSYTYVYDENAGVPYLLSKDKTIFISFDDSRSIEEKCKYIRETGCAGIMYWENGQDTTGDLVIAMYKGLKKNE